MATGKKSCFVISPIGEDGSDIRKRADLVLRHVVTPAVEECGYSPVRADKIAEPGLITSQIIQHIVEDPLVVADLTGSNPNVFYELALRHAIRKPLVQIIHKGDKLPFDLAGMRTIPVDHTDLDSVAEAKSEIIKQIKSVEGKKPDELESPISVAIQLQQLKASDNPEERSMAEILALMNEFRSEISAKLTSIDTRLTDPNRVFIPESLRREMGPYFQLKREAAEELAALQNQMHVVEHTIAVQKAAANLSPKEQQAFEEAQGALGKIKARTEYLRSRFGL